MPVSANFLKASTVIFVDDEGLIFLPTRLYITQKGEYLIYAFLISN